MIAVEVKSSLGATFDLSLLDPRNRAHRLQWVVWKQAGEPLKPVADWRLPR